MKIWVIGRSYPIKQNKMRGSFELEQAQLLAENGNQVSYIAAIFHPINKVKKWGYCSFEDKDVKVYLNSVFFTPERMHVHLPKFQGWIWKKLLKSVEEESGIPDIIHVHYPGMVSIPEAVLEYQKKGARIVTTEHWSKVLNNTMDSFQKKQLIKYANSTDAILCVGQPLREALKKFIGVDKEITVVPNVVSNKFSIAFKENLLDTTYKFIFVGRLAPVKQIDKIVLAFSKVFADNLDVELLIVGDGGERKKIEKIIISEKVEKQIKITGTLPRDKVVEMVQDADALVCFSEYETFGVPVIEAWACGKPVIVSDTLGFLEYWNSDLGCIVSHMDINELANTMQKMYENRMKYDADRISKFAIENFGERAVYQKLMNVYKIE